MFDPDASPVDALTTVLIESLGALGAAGRPEPACRLAGSAYAALRREHPDQAQRINDLMHRLAAAIETDQGADDVHLTPAARRPPRAPGSPP